MPSDSEIDPAVALHRIRVRSVRLQRYANWTKEKIWRGSQRDFIEALAHCAEAGEQARRLYSELQKLISLRSQ